MMVPRSHATSADRDRRDARRSPRSMTMYIFSVPLGARYNKKTDWYRDSHEEKVGGYVDACYERDVQLRRTGIAVV
jgi:hypothetical protein